MCCWYSEPVRRWLSFQLNHHCSGANYTQNKTYITKHYHLQHQFPFVMLGNSYEYYEESQKTETQPPSLSRALLPLSCPRRNWFSSSCERFRPTPCDWTVSNFPERCIVLFICASWKWTSVTNTDFSIQFANIFSHVARMLLQKLLIIPPCTMMCPVKQGFERKQNKHPSLLHIIPPSIYPSNYTSYINIL